jgi:hypothetical protein
MIINEILNEDPQIGDSIDLELGDVLIETEIEDITEDGIVVYLDETAIKMIIDGREQLSESRQKAGNYCDSCDRKITSVPHVCPGSEKLDEAEYQGRKVSLGKPFMNTDGKSKRSVYVKNPKGNVVKVNFGQKGVKIKKNNPARRKSFRARHNCSNPGPRHRARYWSCRFW